LEGGICLEMKLVKNSKGFALPLVLMVSMVLLILGIALLQVSMADTKQATWQNNRIQAHYLGRSGVNRGIIMMQQKLAGPPIFNETVGQLVTQLQAAVVNPYTIPDVGTYTIQFSEDTYSGEIKITSLGTTIGHLPSTQTVTYKKELGTGYSYTNPSSQWMTGINLDKGIDPDTNLSESYLGYAVMLESKNSKNNIHSAKGSSNPSKFRASILAVKDYQGRSLRQINNSINLTFDTEIMLFLGDVKLNSTNDPIYLTVSDEVLEQKTYAYNPFFPNTTGTPGRSPVELDYGPGTVSPTPATNAYAVGFESLDRYRAFINNSTATRSQSFNVLGRYGVVKLGGGIKNASNVTAFNVTDKGYYYFNGAANDNKGVDLHNAAIELTQGDLIKIQDSDPIVAVLDGLIGMNMGSGTALWNNE